MNLEIEKLHKRP